MTDHVHAQGRRIEIYDTTLRDGTQGLGFNLALEDKLAIARELDLLGVDYIEGGYPLSNPKDVAFFREISANPPRNAKVSAFGMTRRKGIPVAEDPGMIALVEAGVPAIALVGKTSEFHVREVLGVPSEENLRMIGESVAFLTGKGREVIYDAEQFFDGFKLNAAYAIETLRAAAKGGARLLCLCDTNGGTLPDEVGEIVDAVAAAIPETPVGVHLHNDSGVAVANAIRAVQRGAIQVQGTINGVGERCGNVDLIPVIANLSLKLGYEVLSGPESLERLVRVSRFVDEAAHLTPQVHQPYVGPAAFTHKGGMHVHAVMKNVTTYEHVPPESVGNERHMLISELSGTSNVQEKLIKMLGRKSDDRELLKRILGRVMDLENEGYVFETAEASFELIVRRHLGLYQAPFEIRRASILSEEQTEAGSGARSEVELLVAGRTRSGSAEGLGPIQTPLGALVEALRTEHPGLEAIRVADFKAHYLHLRRGDRPRIRTTIVFTDGNRKWGTVAVSEDLESAIWRCLVEGIEDAIFRTEGNLRDAMAKAAGGGGAAG
ncbi:MAG: citramalate synthase [Candidatus Eisenbacteria bacterium]|nr:citramalate synthase [Candidatus Latescibacterota bacterium]MBD3301605.1 citramalate synthase [Candidatus Eisenbacteria bacterium]